MQFIYRPVKFNWLTQLWGENRVDYSKVGLKGHNGYDFAAWNGTPVYHSGNYRGIMKTEVDAQGGIGVDIYSDTPQIDGYRIKLRYWHLKSVVGWDGRDISPGELIGFADNTGFSSGDHVHFGLKLIGDNDETLNGGNGYWGALDLTPYYDNVYILDYLEIQKNAVNVIELARKVIFQIRQYIKGLNK